MEKKTNKNIASWVEILSYYSPIDDVLYDIEDMEYLDIPLCLNNIAKRMREQAKIVEKVSILVSQLSGNQTVDIDGAGNLLTLCCKGELRDAIQEMRKTKKR